MFCLVVVDGVVDGAVDGVVDGVGVVIDVFFFFCVVF